MHAYTSNIRWIEWFFQSIWTGHDYFIVILSDISEFSCLVRQTVHQRSSLSDSHIADNLVAYPSLKLLWHVLNIGARRLGGGELIAREARSADYLTSYHWGVWYLRHQCLWPKAITTKTQSEIRSKVIQRWIVRHARFSRSMTVA